MMELFIILLSSVIVLSISWRWKVITTFKKLGIPGPTPNVLFGNLLELYWKGPIKCHEEWTKKYGSVIGYYLGMTPALLVTDPILLKNIFIKDFSKFINRESFSPISTYHPDSKVGQNILNLRGEVWKSVRNVVTPSFTSSKIKQMTGSINSAIEVMLNKLNNLADKKEDFDIFPIYQRLTLDTIYRTGFGIRTDVQLNQKSELFRMANSVFIGPFREPVAFIGLCFPLLKYVCNLTYKIIYTIWARGTQPLISVENEIYEIIRHRRKNPQVKFCDLLQIMIENSVDEDGGKIDVSQFEAGNEDNELKFETKGRSSKQTRRMTDSEILPAASDILLASFETTSVNLAFTTYFLAKHQDVQEKLYQEIVDLFQNNGKLQYADVNKLTYLDKVLSESLRLLPPAFLFTNRYAMEDVQYDHIKIPKGMLIRAPPYFMHHNPELWEEPEMFNPERFDTKPNRNGIKYLPFGVGPRNCLGIRFAQLETKLIFAHMVYNFKIHLSSSQKVPLPIYFMTRTLKPSEGVCVKLEKRGVLDE